MLFSEGEQAEIDIKKIQEILKQCIKPAKQYKKGWDSNRAAAQRERCLKNKPWLHSTGAKTPEGKKKVSMNALKHGLSSIFDISEAAEYAFYGLNSPKTKSKSAK